MRHNLRDQVAWLAGCQSWKEAFGARLDITAMEKRLSPPLLASPVTFEGDWLPLCQRACNGTLHGGEVTERQVASMPHQSAPAHTGPTLQAQHGAPQSVSPHAAANVRQSAHCGCVAQTQPIPMIPQSASAQAAGGLGPRALQGDVTQAQRAPMPPQSASAQTAACLRQHAQHSGVSQEPSFGVVPLQAQAARPNATTNSTQVVREAAFDVQSHSASVQAAGSFGSRALQGDVTQAQRPPMPPQSASAQTAACLRVQVQHSGLPQEPSFSVMPLQAQMTRPNATNSTPVLREAAFDGQCLNAESGNAHLIMGTSSQTTSHPSAGSVVHSSAPSVSAPQLIAVGRQGPGCQRPLPQSQPLENMDSFAYSAPSSILLEELRRWRTCQAKNTNKKPYLILTNKSLEAIAASVPTSQAELLAVHGVGKSTVSTFGDQILQICSRNRGAQPSPCTGVQPLQAVSPGVVAQPMQVASATVQPSAWLEKRGTNQAIANPRAKRPRCERGPGAGEASAAAEAPVLDVAMLNNEQREAAERALRGENLFVTGAAGTGKSFLMRYIIQELEKKYPGKVAVTAPTGLAAVNVGGQTLHSFAGIGLWQEPSDMRSPERFLLSKIQKSPAACERWRETRTLVIDEVSMLDPVFFERLEFVARELRRQRSQGFGGLQLLLCGDFLQLPPIDDSAGGSGAPRSTFCFEAPAWQKCGLHSGTVILREPVRQSGDPAFVQVLNALRAGRCPPEVLECLGAHSCSRRPPPTDGIEPTKLYCTNRDVDQENDQRLEALPGQAIVFKSEDAAVPKQGSTRSAAEEKRLKELLSKKVPKELRLKLEAQVILIRKLQGHNLVNGSRGVVKQMNEREVHVLFDSGQTVRVERDRFQQHGSSMTVTRSQLPLKLGWSVTVHRSQGMTLTRAEVHLGDAFTFGQAYVALSRLTGFNGLWIGGRGLSQRSVRAHPAALAFYNLGGPAVTGRST